MDGSTLTALVSALALLAGAIFGGIAQLRRTAPENIKILQQRLESAEQRADEADQKAEKAEVRVSRLQEQLIATNAELFRFKQLAASHGWLPTEETDEVVSP